MTSDEIIDGVLQAEGSRFTNDPADPGGPTKFGITLATLRRWRRRGGASQVVTAADVRALEEPEAREIYRHRYINDPGFDQLPEEVQPFVVDTGVHFGPRTAAKQLQEAVGAKRDGVVGPKTLMAVELAVAVGGQFLVDLVRIRLDAYARQIRRSVTDHDRELRRLIDQATSLHELRLSTATIGTVGRVTKLRFIRGWIARPLQFLR